MYLAKLLNKEKKPLVAPFTAVVGYLIKDHMGPIYLKDIQCTNH